MRPCSLLFSRYDSFTGTTRSRKCLRHDSCAVEQTSKREGWLSSPDQMIRLTLIGDAARTVVAGNAPYFRVTDGAVWTRPGDDPLVRYADATWLFLGEPWSGMRFEGKCRLVLGLPRDPVRVSDLLDAVSIIDCTLSANGVPFAVYLPDREVWRGAGTGTWWHSFRIESASLRPTSGESVDNHESPAPQRCV